MKCTLLVAVFTFSTLPAFAQDAPPQPYVPIVIDQADMQNIQAIMNHNLPPDYIQVMVNVFNQLEQQAQARAAKAADAKKPPEHKPQPEPQK
jgi:hypothetical protein